MLLVALTGGIGSGKSTVAAALAGRGAVVIDADRIGRAIMEPGGEAYGSVIERFGSEVLREDGQIDRPAVAAIVFSDPAALADLNGLTHPTIGRVIAEQVDAAAAAGASIVVVDVALLDIVRERFDFGAIVVVDTPEDVAVARLMAQRGFTEEDARARMAAQISRSERRAVADLIIDNAGDLANLEAEVARAWEWLTEKAAA